MKRTLFLAFMLLISIMMSAQEKGLLLKETFDSMEIPEGWYIDEHAENWSISTSAKSGGVPNEICMNWAPEFNGTTRLVMPEFDFSDVTTFHHQICENFEDGIIRRRRNMEQRLGRHLYRDNFLR